MVPVVLPVGVIVVGLVLAGRDLGTGLVLLLVLAALLFAAGAPARIFLGAAAVMTGLALVLAVTSANRMARIEAWLKGSCPDQLNTCFQSIHGKYALADGGWWGVGLGASREKWSWLPEAHNDFIFAIIGEELGLVGALVVLALFAVLAWACYRLVVRSDDAFVRIATAGVMAWVIGQALINIGAVIGMLPVIGVPLPLVSSGGTALLTTMFALGHAAVASPVRSLAAGPRWPVVPRCCDARSSSCRGLRARISAGRSARAERPARTMTAPSSVLLAGGGSAGHISPLLSVADALRRRWPDVTITAWARPKASRCGSSPSTATRCAPSRGCRCRAGPDATMLRFPGALSAEIGAAAAVVTDVRADVIAGLRRLRVDGGLPRRPAAAPALRRPRGQHPARAGQPPRCAVHAVRRHDVQRHPAAARGPHRPAAAAGDQHAGPGGSATRGAGPGSGSSRTGRPCSSPAARWAPSGSTRPSRRACPTCGPAGCRCCIWPAPARGSTPAPAGAGEPPYVVLEYCDDMAAAYSAADAVVCRSGANTVCELTAVGLPAVYVPLPVGNGEQRLNAEPVVASGGGLLVADAQFTPGLGPGPVAGLAGRPGSRSPRPGRPPRPGVSATPTNASPT